MQNGSYLDANTHKQGRKQREAKNEEMVKRTMIEQESELGEVSITLLRDLWGSTLTKMESAEHTCGKIKGLER